MIDKQKRRTREFKQQTVEPIRAANRAASRAIERRAIGRKAARCRAQRRRRCGRCAQGGMAKRTGRVHITFAQRCEDYMALRRASGELSENRLRKQQAALRAACLHLGPTDLARVTPEMLERMYRAMLAGQTLSGRTASGPYVRTVHGEVNLLYKDAVRKGIVAVNPCEHARAPRADSEPRRALPPQQMRDLLSRLDIADEHDFVWWLAATLGLRRGEICSLSWSDVDFAGRVLSVRRSFDAFGNLKGAKTSAGGCMLPLTDGQARAFETHREAQAARHGKAEAESPVIAANQGGCVNPDVLGRWWEQDRGRLGAEGFRLHELRHSYLSLLAIAGVNPKVMQELAGHSTCTVTMDVYAHTNMDAKRRAAEALEGLLEGRQR